MKPIRRDSRIVAGMVGAWLAVMTFIVCGQDDKSLPVGINERLGNQVALDTVLKDERGNDITLRQLIDKPTLLTLNYFRCASICTPLLNSVASVIQQIALEPDKDFQVITVSFDPRDTPEIANQKQINYLAQMKRPFPPKAWRFLTGTARSSTDVADSVGFKFRAEGDQYIHPGAIMVLTPTGIVSRYMYGISYLPADVQMALQEAAMQQVRPTISQALSFCYVYDPESRRYVFNITRAVGVATLLAIGVFLIFVLLKGYRHGKSRSQ